jgi:hypothetical protein
MDRAKEFRTMRTILLIMMICIGFASAAQAATNTDNGEVRVPLETYRQLVEQASQDTRPAPAAYAIGVSNIDVDIVDDDKRTTARISVSLNIETFENEWTLVPVLPPGAALGDALVNGAPVQLVQGPDGLAWSTDKAGTVTMQLRYGLDARRSDAGYTLPLPVPRAAATNLRVAYPGTGVDLAIIPAADVQSSESGNKTLFTARIPSTSSVLITWRTATLRSYAVSRARYTGEIQGQALNWNAEFDVEIFEGELVKLPLMPSTVTLGELQVDGEQATVVEEQGQFVTVVKGRGMHKVSVAFQVPVVAENGPPSATLHVPRVPVSQFRLNLPGKKEVSVSPAGNVVTSHEENATTATVFVPMSESVTFSWVDAVPEDVQAQVRANATLYHAVHAEEGVLHVQGLVVYEINRGATNLLKLQVPKDAQVTSVKSLSGGVSDWIESAGGSDAHKTISVFLERAVDGEFVLDVAYELLLGGGAQALEPVAVPLLAADEVRRQRGMVALLAGPELTLQPMSEDRMARVGENQLPAFVRNLLTMSVAHTYKYTERSPELVVKAVAPERKQGKFDAQVDTLISIGDVTMKGSATVEISVKSGALLALTLRLPKGVNVLGVTGPSIRNHDVKAADDHQSIDIDFTQEMEGQFRLEVNYERIMGDGEPEPRVPTVSVADAEVEHGRIAVEALSAVEVRATAADQLSSLDVNELPQQLVLKTTNPILLAYKYVHAQPPYQLVLRITRHREIDVQVAAIEKAHYSTLYTRDGLAVNTARFYVRNSRRQFLRLELPPESQIWSVFVDGKAEKPAAAETSTDGSAVLIKMINSATGFPVEIIYATRIAPMAFMGTVHGRLPTPDMVVTHTRWDVFLPVGPSYRSPDSTLDPVISGRRVNGAVMGGEALARARSAKGAGLGEPLRLSVPSQGIHYAFEKLYANQSPQAATFSLGYASADGHRLGLGLSLLGVVLLWLAIVAIGGRRVPMPRIAALAVLVAGVAMLLAAIAYLGTNLAPAAVMALIIALAIGIWLAARRLLDWRAARTGN